MSEPTVVVVEGGGEPAPVQIEEDIIVAQAAMVAGMAHVEAEHASETAEEALVVAEEAAAVAAVALEVTCCEHCEENRIRLAALEEGRGAELEAALVEEELAAPAPEMRPEPEPKPKAEKKTPPAAPARRGGFWPL